MRHAFCLGQLTKLTERGEARSYLHGVLSEKGSGPAKDRVAKRQAAACIALAALGEVDVIWPLLRHGDDPCLRSFLIEDLSSADFLRQALFDRLQSNGLDAIERQALLLAWAESKLAGISGANRAKVVELARKLYLDDPAPGVHSAAELLLARLAETETLAQCDTQLRQSDKRSEGKDWVLGPNGHTFAILRGPLRFRMGSPNEEEGREGPIENAHERRIDRTLAVATTEVTFDQFHKFQSQRQQKDRYAQSPRCPANGVTWYEAAAYCNWLTANDTKLTKDDRCYAQNVEPGLAFLPDALKRHGYRLPTEAEMEYFCRANTSTSRPFGESEELLPKSAWTWLNSGDRLHPVGMLLPNELGLFDVLGNAYEWCHDGRNRAHGWRPHALPGRINRPSRERRG